MQRKKVIEIDKTKITPAWQRVIKKLIVTLPLCISLITGTFIVVHTIDVLTQPAKISNGSDHQTLIYKTQITLPQFKIYVSALKLGIALVILLTIVWEDRKDSRLLALEEATIQPGAAVAKEERLDSFVKLNKIYYLPLLEKQSVRDFYPDSAWHYSDVYQVYYYLPETLVKDFYKEDYRLSLIEYSTVHGERILSLEDPKLNIFFVTEEGAGFAKSKFISCRRQDSALVVCAALESEAALAGWSRAIELPYTAWTVLGPSYDFVLGEINDYPLGVLEVSIKNAFGILHEVEAEQLKFLGFVNAIPMPYIRFYSSDLGIPVLLVDYNRPDAPATLAGYAQAVDLPGDAEGGSLRDHRREVYVEELEMLDTDYAEMLANHS